MIWFCISSSAHNTSLMKIFIFLIAKIVESFGVEYLERNIWGNLVLTFYQIVWNVEYPFI